MRTLGLLLVAPAALGLLVQAWRAGPTERGGPTRADWLIFGVAVVGVFCLAAGS